MTEPLDICYCQSVATLLDALLASQKEERPYPYMFDGESLEDANRRVASQKEE